MKKLLFFVNVDWFFVSHRLPIAIAAMQKGFEVHIVTGLTDRQAEIESHGIIVHPVRLVRSRIGIFDMLAVMFSFWRVLRLVKPDIVHLVTIKPVLFGGVVARLAGVKSVVVAISGLGFIFINQGLVASVRRWIVGDLYRFVLGHKNSKVIFQNLDDKKVLYRLTGSIQNKSILIPGSGVDLKKYNVCKESEDDFLFVFAARLLEEKGIFEFVDAARIIKAKNFSTRTTVRFAVVGEPDLENPSSITRQQLMQWVNEGVIEYWGYRADMVQVICQAKVVVLPSYYGEGLPKILIEAAACGRAVITTDHPGCRDAIDAGKSGILVPVKDSAALADAMQRLIEDPECCRNMGFEGRVLAEKVFDVESVINTHLQIYSELIASVR